jgi:hypothetical protein
VAVVEEEEVLSVVSEEVEEVQVEVEVEVVVVDPVELIHRRWLNQRQRLI